MLYCNVFIYINPMFYLLSLRMSFCPSVFFCLSRSQWMNRQAWLKTYPQTARCLATYQAAQTPHLLLRRLTVGLDVCMQTSRSTELYDIAQRDHYSGNRWLDSYVSCCTSQKKSKSRSYVFSLILCGWYCELLLYLLPQMQEVYQYCIHVGRKDQFLAWTTGYI